MSIRASNNVFPHDPDDNWKSKTDKGGCELTSQQIVDRIEGIESPDDILVRGDVVKAGSVMSIAALAFTCRINQEVLTNPDEFETTIAVASEGFKRIDILVFTKFATIIKIQGTESVDSAEEPATPEGTIKISFVSVFGDIIDEPVIPIESFVTKMESQDFIASYGVTTVIDQINLIDDRSSVSLIGAITDVKSLRISGEFIRPGKPFFIKNRTGHTVKLWHNSGTGNINFFFANEIDMIFKTGEIIQFNLNANDSDNLRAEYVGFPSGSTAASTTDALPEGSDNLYFKEDRVSNTSLVGLVENAGTIEANDTVLSAFGKVKKTFVDIFNSLANKMNLYAEVVNLPANYTFQLGDEKKMFVYDNATSINVFFEKNSVTAFPIGSKISIYCKNTGAVVPLFSFPATNLNNTVYLSKIILGETRTFTKIAVDAWIADSDLGVTVGTDAETQITAAVPEDNKMVSRLKLFNWWQWQKTLTQNFTGVQVSQFQKNGTLPMYIRVNNFTSDVLEDLRIILGSGTNIPYFQRCILANANKGGGMWERAVSTVKLNNTNVAVSSLAVNTGVLMQISDPLLFTWAVDTQSSKTGALVSELINGDSVKDVDDKTANNFRITFEVSYSAGAGDGTLELSILNPSLLVVDQSTETINIDGRGATKKRVVFNVRAVKTQDNNTGYRLRLNNGSKEITEYRLVNILRTNN